MLIVTISYTYPDGKSPVAEAHFIHPETFPELVKLRHNNPEISEMRIEHLINSLTHAAPNCRFLPVAAGLGSVSETERHNPDANPYHVMTGAQVMRADQASLADVDGEPRRCFEEFVLAVQRSYALEKIYADCNA